MHAGAWPQVHWPRVSSGDEKVKALKAIKPLSLKGDDSEVVRGVYSEGLVGGEKAMGYLSEAGIPDDSFTETYAALCLNIENWRVGCLTCDGRRFVKPAAVWD